MLCQSPFSRLESFQDCKQLYQFLDFCRQKTIEEKQPKIASVTLKLESIDPLVVLDQWVRSDQPHFYFENREKGWAVAAINATVSFETKSSERFLNAQTFIQSTWDQLIVGNSPDLPWATPRFFCSFTFFDHESSLDSVFPSASLFLPEWQIFRYQNYGAAIANIRIDSHSKIDDITQTIWQQFKQIQATQYHFLPLSSGVVNGVRPWQIRDPYDFRRAVRAVLQSIQAGQFDKLVLAHAIDVVSPMPFQWGHSLNNLRQMHPDCYVFSTANQRGQSFIGASPERLLSIYKRRLITDALAGSAARGRTIAEDAAFTQRLLNSEKERREHQVVVDFITQRLIHLGLKPQFASRPKPLQLSNIQHLHTPIQAILPSEITPLDILAELHPTPAVAGLPRDIACQQIRQHEPFERSLYAGPLGWIDPQGNAEFIVGIRSALLEGHRARLYAGAGIVAGSDPDRELAEIRLKLQALLRTLV